MLVPPLGSAMTPPLMRPGSVTRPGTFAMGGASVEWNGDNNVRRRFGQSQRSQTPGSALRRFELQTEERGDGFRRQLGKPLRRLEQCGRLRADPDMAQLPAECRHLAVLLGKIAVEPHRNAVVAEP